MDDMGSFFKVTWGVLLFVYLVILSFDFSLGLISFVFGMSLKLVENKK